MKRTNKTQSIKTSRASRRLQLRKELVRNLSTDELRNVHGGYDKCGWTECDPNTICYNR